MKKYFSNIRTLAALLMAGAAFAACSSDDSNIIEQPANPAGEKVYTLTINASKGGAATRALELDGSKLVAKWETTDVLSVFKAASRSACIPANYLGTISPVAGTISADGDAATFRGTISGATAGDKLMLVYHPNAFTIDAYAAQTGTLASASALDCATAVVTVDAVSGTDVTITESKATFTTQTAMLKLTLTTDGSTTINPTSLKMTMALGTVTLKEFTFTPDAATYTANGDGVLYFALPSADDVATAASLKLGYAVSTTTLAGMKITYTATVGSDIYTVTKTGYSFEAGKYYAGTLTMTKQLGHALTSAAVGEIVGSDGLAYAAAHKDDLPSGVTAVAMVTYKGSATGETGYANGLALALSDANGGSRCYWSTSTSSKVHTYYTDDESKFSSISESGLQYNNSSFVPNHNTDEYPAFKAAMANNGTTAPTNCSAWFLPTCYQLQLMIDACKNVLGTNNNFNDLRNAFTGVGGENMKSEPYWLATEYEALYAWRYLFDTGRWSGGGKDSNFYVRSAIAF